MASIEQLQYDGKLDIAVGLKFNSKVWKNTKTEWSKLVNKLSKATVTNESHAQFMKASKKEGFDKKRGVWYYIGLDTLFNIVGAIILVPLSYLSLGLL